eukprot:gene24628-10250_t
MARVMAAMSVSRALRVVCFMTTVLPNPRPGCYIRRFPPVPDSIWEMIMAGYTTIRGFGGCNDLVVSGHGVFWTIVPLAFQAYYRTRPEPETKKSTRLPTRSKVATFVVFLLWAAVVQSSVRDVMERYHYSVDMILAIVVSAASWTWTEWVYPSNSPLPKRPQGGAPDKVNGWVLALVAVGVTVAGVIVIGGNT